MMPEKLPILPGLRRGFSMIELMIAIAIVGIPLAAIGILMAGSSRCWQDIYNDANSKVRSDSLAFMAAIHNYGRQANITNYKIYKIKKGAFVEAAPLSGQTVAGGQGVEFRYWGKGFDAHNPASDALGTMNTGTHYVLFYLDNDKLKADFGNVVDGVGGVYSNSRQTSNIVSTQVLVDHVDIQANSEIFSHTVTGGQGNGCVNSCLFLTDNDRTFEIRFATMLRAAWPR